MSAGLRLMRAEDPAEWDALAMSLSDRPDFHRWQWLDLHAAMRGIVIERLLVVNQDRPVGLVPIPRHSRRSLTGATLPFPYLGPLVPEALLADTVRAYRGWQRRHGLLLGRFELTPPASARSAGVLERAGCSTGSHATVTIDLARDSVAEVRRSYSDARRKAVNRARRAGVTTRRSHPGELAALLPAVLDDIFAARARQSPYPARIGADVEAWLAGRDDAVAFVAELDGQAVGVQIALGAGPVALDWVGGCFRRVHLVHANAALYDRVIEWAFDTGHRAIDLCGDVDAGVLQFKLRFGGEAHPYTTAESSVIPAPLLTAAQWARHRLRRPATGA